MEYNYPWHEAPKWANYAATNSAGLAMWYEHEPVWFNGDWQITKGRFCRIGDTSEQSLQKRPD